MLLDPVFYKRGPQVTLFSLWSRIRLAVSRVLVFAVVALTLTVEVYVLRVSFVKDLLEDILCASSGS